MVKAYIKADQKYRDDPKHANAKSLGMYADVYEWFVRDVFFDRQAKFEEYKNGMFGTVDHKKIIEEYFNVKL